MIRHDVAATSEADLELSLLVISAVEGCQAATEYRDAALTFVREAIAGPQELFPAAEEIVVGLCNDAAAAVLAANPDLAISRQRLVAYIIRTAGAISAYGDHGGVVLDLR
jgi:hypothetical protein